MGNLARDFFRGNCLKRKASSVPVLLVLALGVFGSIKVAVGISRIRPVEILIGFILFPTLISALGFSWPIRRTAKGREALKRL